MASLRTALVLASVCTFAACSSSSTSSSPTDAPAASSDAGAVPGDGGGTTDDASDGDGGTTPLPACGPDPLPAPCDVAATTAPAAGDFGADGVETVHVTTLDNPHATAPGKVSVYFPVRSGKTPVLFFSHAYGATDPASYDALFRHLASRGYSVVHVPYPSRPAVTAPNADRYDCLWEGFNAAVSAFGAAFDLTHVGFFGHSFGGGATPEMARRGFGQGWGTAGRFMFVMAPWYSWGTGYDSLPADVRTVVQVYADDNANDHQIAVNDVWSKLPAAMEKSWQLIRTDVCGSCGLDAPHILPMTGQSVTQNPAAVLNGNDLWGTYRRLDALAAYAFEQNAAARAVAYGLDTGMGNFVGCGGRAVRPLESSMTTPITTTCLEPLYPYSARCANADPGVACP